MTNKPKAVEPISAHGQDTADANDNDLSLQLLERDLTTYLDLHGVFTPETNDSPPALSSITQELRERLTEIVRSTTSQKATSIGGVAKKLEIFSIAAGNEAANLPRYETDRLLRSAIDDLKAMEPQS